MLEYDKEICPRCGKEFRCSKSGKCWCYEVYIPLDKLEEIEQVYDSCLCPTCLGEYAKKEYPPDRKFSRDSFLHVKGRKRKE